MTLLALVVTSAALAVSSAAMPSPVQSGASILGLVMEKATFDDARRVLGPANVWHNGGDAAASAEFVCFVGGDGTVLILEADGEQGGGKVLTSFQLLARLDLADFSPLEGFEARGRPKCAQTPKLSRGTPTGAGMRLGMTRSEASSIQPPSASAQSALFSVTDDEERPVRDQPGCVTGTATVWTVIELERGRVSGIRVTYSSML
jgi:hypothetical protein